MNIFLIKCIEWSYEDVDTEVDYQLVYAHTFEEAVDNIKSLYRHNWRFENKTNTTAFGELREWNGAILD